MKTNRINFKNEDNNKIFFTADLHFGHKLMTREDLRNFESIKKMDTHLIEQWNKTVSKDGKVFMLGDFTWYRKPEEIKNIFSQLNGSIYLIRGNHDESLTTELIKDIINIKSIQTYAELMVKVEDDTYEIVLSHFPFEIWDRKHYGSIHLHGHCHAQLPINENIRRMYVGVDSNEYYRPFTFNEIAEIMAGVDFRKFME